MRKGREGVYVEGLSKRRIGDVGEVMAVMTMIMVMMMVVAMVIGDGGNGDVENVALSLKKRKLALTSKSSCSFYSTY